MFDSYVVTLFHRLYVKLKMFYNNSYLKKLGTKLDRNLSLAASSSTVVRILSSKADVKNVKVYNLYLKFVDLIEKIITFFRSTIKKHTEFSCIFVLTKKLFESKKSTVETISVFAFSFALSLAVINAFNKSLNLEFAKYSAVVVILAILVSLSSKKISIAISKSFVVNLVRDIFTIEDEEEISWK